MSTERISVLHMPSIALGPGSSREAGHHLKLLGVEHALVVTDRFLLDSGLIDPVVQAVEADGVRVTVHAVPTGEPTEATMQEAADAAIAGHGPSRRRRNAR